MMRAHGALIFASAAQGSATEVQRHPHNFTGCLEGLELNGEPIRAGEVAEWAGPGSRRVFGVYQCCSRAGACDNNPCQNGGVCVDDTSGGEYAEVLVSNDVKFDSKYGLNVVGGCDITYFQLSPTHFKAEKL